MTKFLCLLALVATLGAGSASGKTVVILKSGARVEAEVVTVSGGNLILRVKSGQMQLAKSQLAESSLRQFFPGDFTPPAGPGDGRQPIKQPPLVAHAGVAAKKPPVDASQDLRKVLPGI